MDRNWFFTWDDINLDLGDDFRMCRCSGLDEMEK